MIRYGHVVAFVNDHHWAMRESTIGSMLEVVSRRSAGVRLDRAELDARIESGRVAAGPRSGPARGSAGTIAVIQLYGIICQRMSLMDDMSSGGCALDRFGRAFDEAVASADVVGIVIDVASPGGTVDGVPEMAARIRAARGTKPIVAVSDSQCCSAAFWLASQADEVIVAPSSMTGSIGVFAVHTELSKFDAEEGITNTIIRAGKYKAETNDMEPLTDEARAHIQSDVDYFYSMFINDISRGRGVSSQAVLGGFGEGRALVADEAVAAGLADSVGTLEDAIVRCASGKVGRGARAVASSVELVAVDLPPATPEQIADSPGIAAQIEAQLAEAQDAAMLADLDYFRARSRAHR